MRLVWKAFPDSLHTMQHTLDAQNKEKYFTLPIYSVAHISQPVSYRYFAPLENGLATGKVVKHPRGYYMKVTRPDQKPHMLSYFMIKNRRLLGLDVLSSYKILACNRFISYRNNQKFNEQ